jgi:8-oxo-dGTP diphosphatase
MAQQVKSSNTTLVYIMHEDKVLMLHRNRKENDPNEGKWIGIGGHFEQDESPEDCMLREVREETGLSVSEYRYRAIVTFVSDRYETEYMHLFTVTAFSGDLIECDEGTLDWIDFNKLFELPHWKGDEIFLKLIRDSNQPFFSLKLRYGGKNGDELIQAVLNGLEL